jgi:hypothetical protein
MPSAARKVKTAPAAADARWLLLFHQIPPTPAYLRVKIGRRLARVGAVGLKNSVYVLPKSEGALEDFQWVMREVTEGGGDATLCEARFVEGLSDGEIERRFQEVRDEDYAAIVADARKLSAAKRKSARSDDDTSAKLEADVARLEKRLEEIAAIDFFHAAGRESAVGVVGTLRAGLTPSAPSLSRNAEAKERYVDKTWVTRTGVHVDRIASAWLIRRLVDAKARFKFVPAKGYEPRKDEVRFDMFDAEFTHEGEKCTFEVLLERLAIREPGVQAIAEVVHDIDLKESKFDRPETAGIAAAIVGLCTAERADDARLEAGFALFDHLRAFFARRRS